MKTDLIIREPDLYFDSIHNELNNFLRDTILHPAFSNPLTLKKSSIWRPAAEIKQTENEYKVKIQLPGVNKDDIEVELDNDFMTITAKIEEEKEEKEQNDKNSKYHTCEFRYGKYQRTISFDQPIRAEETKAKDNNGVLKITIPKIKDTETKKHQLKIN